MAECTVSHQVLKELYHEIYKLHWSYLELEDGMQKLEEQKQLEGLLKKFLCVVPHNRKFFLPETFAVFKRTVTQMKDFSVVKMLNGFESISQYANNLFTKPWRKEYRTIQMYSGFFIHEIKSNLIEPEQLFVAMGYKKMPNNELVLDGEICPDQVMNMSRDAMTAYTECKIMNRIYSELTTTFKISCSWIDVFNYREQHTGGVTETIEAIKQLIQHNLSVPRDKQLGMCFTNNNNGLPTSVVAAAPHPNQQPSPLPQCPAGNHVQQLQSCNNDYLSCNGQTTCSHQMTGIPHQQQQQLSSHHHHHYEQPVDLFGNNGIALENTNNSNFYHHHHGAMNYGQSGPAAISNVPVCSLHPHSGGIPNSYSNAVIGSASGQQRMMPQQSYAPHNLHHHQQQQQHQIHPQHTTPQELSPSVCDYGPHPMLPHSKSLDHYSYPTVLNDVQQQQHLSKHQMVPHRHSMDQYEGQFGRSHGNNHYYEPVPANAYNVSGTRYPLPYSISAQFGTTADPTAGQYMMPGSYYDGVGPVGGLQGMNMKRCDNNSTTNNFVQPNMMMMASNGGNSYARTVQPPPPPPQMAPRTQYYSQLQLKPEQGAAHFESSDEVDKYAVNGVQGGRGNTRNLKVMHDQEQQTPRSSDFDSYEELYAGENSRNAITAAATTRKGEMMGRRPDKIQDGVGSFETWDYVYQSLDQERKPEQPVRANGRSGVVKEAVKSKTMSRQEANKIQEQMSSLRAVKPVGLEDGERRERKASGGAGQHQKSNSMGGSGVVASKAATVNGASHQRQASDSGLNGGHKMGSRTLGSTKVRQIEVPAAFRGDAQAPTAVVGQNSEWSCRFCTFLNDNSKRICEMCAKSKDFNLDNGSSAATCV